MRGGVRVGDTIELPELRQQKKIKSMQMFRWMGQDRVWCDRWAAAGSVAVVTCRAFAAVFAARVPPARLLLSS